MTAATTANAKPAAAGRPHHAADLAHPLCIYSQPIDGTATVPACPLALTRDESGHCPCWQRRGRDFRFLSCLYPATSDGEEIVLATARMEATLRDRGLRKVTVPASTVSPPTATTGGQPMSNTTASATPAPAAPAQTPTPPTPTRPTPAPARNGPFQRATRHRLKLRMAIDGPSGSGKSVTALRCAQALAARGNGRIAVIDSERGSAQLYVGEDYGEGPIDFDHMELHSFSPTEYTSAIEAGSRLGYDVVLVDSLSQAWEGKDGALELLGKSTDKNKFTAWKDVTPMHRRMVDAILQSACHVIVTMRSKTDYVQEENEKGKLVPKRVGMAPIQRPGMEYEFDLYLSMDWSHIATVTKSRCSAVDGLSVVKPGGPFMASVIDWLEKGSEGPAPPVVTRASDAQVEAILSLYSALHMSLEKGRAEIIRRFGVGEFNQLTPEHAGELITRLTGQLDQSRKKAAARAAHGDGQTPQKLDPVEPLSPAGAPAAAQPHTADLDPIRLDTLNTLRDLYTRLLADGGMDQATWTQILETDYRVDSATQLTETDAQHMMDRAVRRLAYLADVKRQEEDQAKAAAKRGG